MILPSFTFLVSKSLFGVFLRLPSALTSIFSVIDCNGMEISLESFFTIAISLLVVVFDITPLLTSTLFSTILLIAPLSEFKVTPVSSAIVPVESTILLDTQLFVAQEVSVDD
jgi:hypothetical protein